METRFFIAGALALSLGLPAALGQEPPAAPAKSEPEAPKPAPAPAWTQPQPEQPRAPIEPPRNVFELPISQPQAQQPAQPAPQAAAPKAATASADNGPRSVPIDLVQRNPQQPRKHFDEAELTELANSIRSHGVLQPILVRPIAGGRYEIVAGERRWRAAQRAGLHSIPAVVRELDEVEVLEIAIVENVQRTDLNPIEEAQAYRRLTDELGLSQEAIAAGVGKDRATIANYMRLLKLPQEVRNDLAAGALSMGHARALITLGDEAALRRKIDKGFNKPLIHTKIGAGYVLSAESPP